MSRSNESDRQLRRLFASAMQSDGSQIALAAVGGYGRGELSTGSDLDLLILHDGKSSESELLEFVHALLYPIWDGTSGSADIPRSVDYSVRTPKQTRDTAREDLKVAMGLIDLRFICGAESLVDEVKEVSTKDWRKGFAKRINEIRQILDNRYERTGELAYLLEPDLKEARGGLRDITVLRAIASSGFVPVALERIERAERVLGDIREALHIQSGRSKDRLLFHEQDKVAVALGYSDADALMGDVAQSARDVDYLMVSTWKLLNKDKERAHTTLDEPLLRLRSGVLANPWSRQTREDFVTFIGAGSAMVNIWEELDQEGEIASWLPEWSAVRSLPQRNYLHRHTVDRHMVETAVHAAALIRRVHRPDLLLIAALFHDIGKGSLEDHSERGERLIRPLVMRMGFNEVDISTIQLLVKHHLLLSATATRRDLDDPATIASVLALIPDLATLELLHALSVADGEAAGAGAWSEWKAGLVADLVRRVRAAMSGTTLAQQPELSDEQREHAQRGLLRADVRERDGGFSIEIISPDRPGLLSIVAGVLNLTRLDVRSARTKSHGKAAVMEWIVSPDPHAPRPTSEKLSADIQAALDGEIDLAKRIQERIDAYSKMTAIPFPPPEVETFLEASVDATVFEVRSHDRPALLFRIGEAITRCRVDIRSTIVTTLGAEAIDTIYVTEIGGGPLSPERAQEVAQSLAHALR
ncbi:MAG: HD domain-containing protein [Actinobacteria bacterium]|nr:HD domain-containing protein [Actinomycetota bacterium]MTA99848.1 HD domain-containing protein [Actinomycetota bacterium]